MSREEKAEEMFAQAESMATKFNWFGITKQNNNDDAAEIFKRAGAQFKSVQNYERAGQSFERAADCSLAAGSELDAMGHFREAGDLYLHCDLDLAARAYRQAIDFYLNGNRFQQAAKIHEKLAEGLARSEKKEEAIREYEEAIVLWESEHDDSSANKRRSIVAELHASIGNFQRAIENFERVIRDGLNNNLLRWSQKKNIFTTVLCHIPMVKVDNPGSLVETVERYKAMTDLFATSREAQVCEQLAQAILNADKEAYREAYTEYQSVTTGVSDLDTELIHQGLALIDRIHAGRQGAEPVFLDAGDEDGFGSTDATDNATGGGVENPFGGPDEDELPGDIDL